MGDELQRDLPKPDEESSTASVLDILITLAKHKSIVIGLPLAAAVVSVIVSLLLPEIYTGTAKILPPQQNQTSAAMILSQLGGGTGLPLGMLGVKNQGDVFVAILKSRTIADTLIKRFDLMKVYEKDLLEQARRKLEDSTNIVHARDGVIMIEIDDRDPKRAADLANAYVEELENLTLRLAVTEAAQRRLFFDRQLQQAKKDLAEAEVAMQKTQETTGLIKLDDQGKAIIEAVALLRAQITAKEVQLTAMRSFATEKNPELIRAQRELAGLRSELVKMEKTNTAGQGNIFVPTGRVPEAGLEYLRRLRDVKYYETVFELLAKQLELAKIDEAKDAALVQVLDKAIEPERRSKPKRTLIVIATTIVTFFLTVVIALLLDALQRARLDPVQARQLDSLVGYLRDARTGTAAR